MSARISRRTFGARLEHMIHQLRGRILNGTYAENDYLPSESALAKQFQLSNNSVRKGLEALVEEGLIVKVDKVGSRVIAVSDRERTTITIACHPSIERDLEFSTLLEDFHREYPAIRVQPVAGKALGITANRFFSDTVRECIENESVDLFTVNHSDFSDFVGQGWTGLLEPLPVDGDTYPFLTEAFSVNGTPLVSPLLFSPVVLCYNKDHFAEAGILTPDSSWTWEHLLRAAAKLAIPGRRHGFHFFQLSENRWPLFLLQSGARFERNAEGGYSPTDGAKLMEGIRLYGDITRNRDVFPSYLPENEPEASRLFAEGKVSMQLATYNSLNDLKRSGVRYDIAPVPYPAASRTPATLAIAIGLLASGRSKHKEAVKLFASYAASRHAQQLLRERTLSIPASKPAAEAAVHKDDGLNRPEHFRLFREIIPSYRWHADLGLPIRLLQPLHHQLKMYWSDMTDEDALLEQLSRLSGDSD
ncbi:extracellular solute-binding protein [Paenibacillus mesophilus]|uniref:extracellular solute-binding protein n=1 Tax=Paenibacillus mesophilus TaxID=2582849 RepID=UPI00110E6DDD|nr:extracellular solute-binding protein [Paenibacillus mesophilus]TMV45967.1 extracellular solute-binding protein [Paenibacillus mesophilus]